MSRQTLTSLIALTMAAAIAPQPARAADDDLVVVVNKANGVGNLTKSQLRKLVLGEQESWPGGARVTVVMRVPGSDEREGVLRSVCRMSEDAYGNHIKSIEAMYKTVHKEASVSLAPKAMISAVAVRNLVANTPGAVGFLRQSEMDPSVKAVTVDGTAPGDPDYKIKAMR